MLLYLTLLLVLSTSTCSNRTRSQQISPHKLNCKNIKCPPVEDPVCVKIKDMNGKNKKITYIVAVNKCEMQYAKCRSGIDAVKVPMEKCLHSTNVKNTSNKRSKRAASGEMPSIAVIVAKNTSGDNPDEKDIYIRPVIDEAAIEAAVNEAVGDDTVDDGAGDEKVENTEDATENPLEKPAEEKKEEDINHIGADYDQVAEEVDFTQYEKECPTVCPARQVMVCARCQHNIYRTFLSLCHLRVFHCKYPEEKLELINRQPCIQSAPFLTNLPEAKGIISEPGDQDDILKFIFCRDKGRIGKDDQRCKFEDK